MKAYIIVLDLMLGLSKKSGDDLKQSMTLYSLDIINSSIMLSLKISFFKNMIYDYNIAAQSYVASISILHWATANISNKDLTT